MIKAVFFDLDGTLLSHTSGRIPESTIKALEALGEKGVKRFLATGRHLLELEELPGREIPFDGYVTLNGQLCLDRRRQVVFDDPVREPDLERVLEVFHGREIPLMLVEQNRMYLNFVNEDVRLAQGAISTPIPAVEGYNGGKVYQIVAYGEESQAEWLLRQLPGCKMSRWNPCAVDIISRSGGKVAGIQYFMDKYRIRQEEVMAFGDGENDMDMLKFAGAGIAMGNAGDAVKGQADYVTAHIDDGGIAAALRHYGLI